MASNCATLLANLYMLAAASPNHGIHEGIQNVSGDATSCCTLPLAKRRNTSVARRSMTFSSQLLSGQGFRGVIGEKLPHHFCTNISFWARVEAALVGDVQQDQLWGQL